MDWIYASPQLAYARFTGSMSTDQVMSSGRVSVSAYFFNHAKPSTIRLHLVRDEILTRG